MEDQILSVLLDMQKNMKSMDARLDKIDARLDNLKSDLTELRISVLMLSDPVKLTIPRDIHSLSDDVKDISEKIQIFLPDGQGKGV